MNIEQIRNINDLLNLRIQSENEVSRLSGEIEKVLSASVENINLTETSIPRDSYPREDKAFIELNLQRCINPETGKLFTKEEAENISNDCHLETIENTYGDTFEAPISEVNIIYNKNVKNNNDEIYALNQQLELEKEHLKELKMLEDAYNSVRINLLEISKLDKTNSKDSNDAKKVKQEIETRQKVVSENMSKLPEILQETLRQEIIEINKGKTTKQTKNVVSSESLLNNPIENIFEEARALQARLADLQKELEVTTDLKEQKKIVDEISKIAPTLEFYSNILQNGVFEEARQKHRGEKPTEELNKDGLSQEAADEIDRLEKEISDLRSELKDNEKKRKVPRNKMSKIYNDYKINQEQNGPFDTATLNANFENYMKQMVAEDQKLTEIDKKIKKINNKIRSNKKKIDNIKKYSLEANSLEISYVEYMKIVQVLEKNRKQLLTKIYEKKNLSDVIHKKGGRTKAERAMLEEARNEIFREIIKFQKNTQELMRIEDIINILYDVDYTSVKRESAPKQYKMTVKELDNTKDNIVTLSNEGPYQINKPTDFVTVDSKQKSAIRPVKAKSTGNKQKKEVPVKTSTNSAIIVPTEFNRNQVIANEQPVLPIQNEIVQDNKVEEVESIVKEPVVKEPKATKEGRKIGEILIEISAVDDNYDNNKPVQVNVYVASKSFIAEMKAENYNYNIHNVLPNNGKAYYEGTEMLCKEVLEFPINKERMNQIESNIENLTEEDLEVLSNWYENIKNEEEKVPVIVKEAIKNKCNEYVLGKVETLNATTTSAFNQLITINEQIKEIDRQLEKTDLIPEYIEILNNNKKQLGLNAIQYINIIKSNGEKLKDRLGFGNEYLNELIKDRISKNNQIVYKDVNDYHLDSDLEERLTEYRTKYNEGIITGDGVDAQKAFLQEQIALDGQSKINKGKKYTSPLEVRIKAQSNPKVRDFISTISVIPTEVPELDEYTIISQAKDELDINSKGMSETMKKGIKHQLDMNINEAKRIDLVPTNSKLQEFYREVVRNSQLEIQKVINKVANGNCSDEEVLGMLVQLRTRIQKSFMETIKVSLMEFQKYIPDHNFDINEIEESLNRGNIGLSINNGGQQLLSLTKEEIDKLPEELWSSINKIATIAMIIGDISNSINRKYGKSTSNNNEILEMMEEEDTEVLDEGQKRM